MNVDMRVVMNVVMRVVMCVVIHVVMNVVMHVVISLPDEDFVKYFSASDKWLRLRH